MNTHTRHVVTVSLVLVVLAIGLGAFVASGIYNMGADDPHYKPTLMMLTQMRERSIDTRAGNLQVPNLDDPARIKQGAANFNSMCSGCHIPPGGEATEISQGLYPSPPKLSELAKVEPAHAFWVIKHGLKMSGMPAWGVTMYDSALWDMVAALPKISKMSPAEYKTLVEGVEETGQKHPDAEPANAGETKAAASNADMRGMQGMKAMSGMAGMNGMAGMKDAAPTTAKDGDQFKSKAAPAAEAVAKAFHSALQNGDRKAVLALLSPDVAITEEGQTQSRDEYASGHLGEDFAFLKAARIKQISLASMAMGDAAMVRSVSEVQASHDGVPMTMLSSELLTLKQTPSGWKIVKVQWTSGRLPGA